MTNTTRPDGVLRAYAENRISHLNRGICPDWICGFDRRDPDCPVCQALAAAPKPGAGWVSIPAETAARIAQILRNEAECLRECHAPKDDWTGEPEAQADHDEWIALADQLEALTAAPPAPVAAGWRPIDSIPKDGSHVLVWVQAVQCGEDDEGAPIEKDVSFCDIGWWRTATDPVEYGYFDYGAMHTYDAEYVTHWQPMPLPPSPEAEVSHDHP